MAMNKGDHFRCSNTNCGCEVEVTQSSGPGANQSPRCGCGSPMEKTAGVKAA